VGIGVAQLNTEGFCDGIVLPVRTARVGARAANQAGNSRSGGQLLGGVLPHTLTLAKTLTRFARPRV